MTVDGLYKNTKTCATSIPIQSLENWVVGVDADFNLVQVTKGGSGTAAAMKGLIWRTLSMMEAGVKPVIVFDGERPELKQAVYDKKVARARAKEQESQKKIGTVGLGSPKRRKKKHEDMDLTFKREPRPIFCFGCQKRGHVQGDCPTNPTGIGQRLRFTSACDKRSVRIKGQDIRKRQSWASMFPNMARIFELIGVPVIQSKMEADEVLAALSLSGAIDAVASDDMDTIVFGSKCLIRRINFVDGLKQTVVEVLYKDDVLDTLGFKTDDEFVKMCTICKNDYNIDATLSLKKATAFVTDGLFADEGTPPADSELDWIRLWKVQRQFNTARNGMLADLCTISTPKLAEFTSSSEVALRWDDLKLPSMTLEYSTELLSLLLDSPGFKTDQGITHAKNIVTRASRAFGTTLIPTELMGGRGLDVTKQVPRSLRKVSAVDTKKLQRERDEKRSKEMRKMAEKRFKERLKIVKRNIAKELQAEIARCKNDAAKKLQQMEEQLRIEGKLD